MRETRLEAETEVATVLTLDIPISRDRGGYEFISSWDVCRAGYQAHLVPDTLVCIGKRLYEVVGYIPDTRFYWIERVKT